MYENCLDCPHHEHIPDGDPGDPFDSDVALVCRKSSNPDRNMFGNRGSDHSRSRVILDSLSIFDNSPVHPPEWCPLK